MLVLGVRLAVAQDAPRLPMHERQERAAKLVQEALRMRAAGVATGTRELLAQAVSTAPDFAPAHWQLGEVQIDRSWMALAECQKTFASNRDLDEYTRQRDDCARSAAAIWLNHPSNAVISEDAPRYLRAPRTSTRFLRKTFELTGRPRWAQLQVRVVGRCDVFVNGHPVMQSATNRWSGIETVTAQLRGGNNVIAMAIHAVNEQQIPGARVWLEGVEHDQKIFTVPTDGSWRVGTDKTEGWRTLHFDDSQWEAADPTQEPPAESELRAEPTVSTRLETALARWCHAHALPEQAQFYWTHVLHFQPDNAEAIKALGLVRHREKLLTKAQLEDAKKAERDASLALAHWLPILRKVQLDLDRKTPKGVEAARTRLRDADLAAIPAFEQVLSETAAPDGAPAFVTEFIESVLSRFDDPASTTILVNIARNHSQQSVRDVAIEPLKTRDMLSFFPELMGALQAPVEVQTSFKEVQTSRKKEGTTAVCTARFFRPGVDFDEEHTETYEYKPDQAETSRAEALGKAQARQRQIEAEVAAQNQALFQSNERIMIIMRRVSGTDQGDAPAGWWKWWGDYNELLIPTENRVRRTSYFNTEYIRSIERSKQRYKDCFAKGTPVWTPLGLRPIETIRVGDTVLAQDVEKGELAFKVVLGTSIRAASPMISTRIGDETIVSTRGHRYWVNGKGWRMAKNLKAGDVLHGVEEPLEADEVLESRDEVAWNLIVDDFNSYFVGRQGVLVHDTGAPRPTRAIVPGLPR
jgi:hypothetical protein